MKKSINLIHKRLILDARYTTTETPPITKRTLTTMPAHLKIWKDNKIIANLPITPSENKTPEPEYHINWRNLPMPDEQEIATDVRRRRNRRFLNRIGDPENGFPIIRSLIEQFGPILMQFLLKQLPIWLADIDAISEEDEAQT